MANKYKNYKKADILNALPGYANNAWLTPVDFIDTFADVVGSVEIGNKKTIDESHVYMTNKGSIAVYCAPKSVEAPAEMVGEPHAKRFRWLPKIILIGDGPIILEMAENIINETFLLHFANGECEGNQKVQFGSKCTPCVVDAGSFASGTLGDGRKQYEFTAEAFNKYFYNGVITEYDPELDV